MKFTIVVVLQVLAISTMALPIEETIEMPPPVGAIASLIGKEAPVIAKEAPKLIHEAEKIIPKIVKEAPKITKEAPKVTKTLPKLSKDMEKALSHLKSSYVPILTTVATIDTDMIYRDCGQIVNLFRQNGVHADDVAKKLHLPTDVVKTAWEVFQITGKCQV
jgi:hypothetical protein